MDRAASLRGLESLARDGSDYLQLLLHKDEEYRDSALCGDPGRARDGVVAEDELGEGDRLVRRSDEELEAYCADRLREVTDLAEAAHGGQLVLTWYPLLGAVALDVYERYLSLLLSASGQALDT